MALDWQAVREQFPVLRDWAYLNTATFGPVPRCALEAMEGYFRRRDEQACLDFVEWFDDAARVRSLAAALIHAEPADIAFAPGTGPVLGWLVQGLDWRPGDRVVALEHEFPTNSYTAHSLAARGVEFVEVPLPAGEFRLDRFLEAIDARTRLVLLSAVSYSSGLRPPLAEIGRALRERGVRLYVDATQSLGALRFDVRTVPVDVLAVHAYKWLCSPPGIGFAYIAPETRAWLEPAFYSWRSHRDWRQVEQLHSGPPELPEGAEKYEGGVQNFSGIFALGAVLEMMLDLGVERIERRVLGLAEAARGLLRAAGAVLPADRFPYYDSSLAVGCFPDTDVAALAARLRDARVAVAVRQGTLRVSPHFFNHETDLERLAEALAARGNS